MFRKTSVFIVMLIAAGSLASITCDAREENGSALYKLRGRFQASRNVKRLAQQVQQSPGGQMNDAAPAQLPDGSTRETVNMGGETRAYYVREPEHRDKSKPLPMVLVFHGGGGRAHGMPKLSAGISALSDREQFVLVYPDGVNRHWNDGRQVNMSEHDDVAFISTLIDKLTAERNIDSKRVYATGISNGGFFSQALAMQLPEKIAAVASVAATVPVEWKKEDAKAPVPVMFILGTDDPLVPWNGGHVGGRYFKRGTVISEPEAVNFWLQINRLSGERVTTRLPDSDPKDGVIVTKHQYGGKEGSAPLVVYELDGGGHTWPQGSQFLPVSLVGRVCQDINANEVIWDFFKQHKKS